MMPDMVDEHKFKFSMCVEKISKVGYGGVDAVLSFRARACGFVLHHQKFFALFN